MTKAEYARAYINRPDIPTTAITVETVSGKTTITIPPKYALSDAEKTKLTILCGGKEKLLKKDIIDKGNYDYTNTQIHPQAPHDAQMQILRKQLTEMLDALKLTPTEEFARLTDTADGKEKKLCFTHGR